MAGKEALSKTLKSKVTGIPVPALIAVVGLAAFWYFHKHPMGGKKAAAAGDPNALTGAGMYGAGSGSYGGGSSGGGPGFTPVDNPTSTGGSNGVDSGPSPVTPAPPPTIPGGNPPPAGSAVTADMFNHATAKRDEARREFDRLTGLWNQTKHQQYGAPRNYAAAQVTYWQAVLTLLRAGIVPAGYTASSPYPGRFGAPPPPPPGPAQPAPIPPPINVARYTPTPPNRVPAPVPTPVG